MSNEYVSLRGKVIAVEELHAPKAKKMAQVLSSGILHWVKLVECQRHYSPAHIEMGDEQDEFVDIVIFDTEVELPQRKTHGIHRIERIAVGFSARDSGCPETVALRQDFPLVPHRNLRQKDRPVSLCLFNEPYSDVKLRWTAPWFIEAIRTWLAKTAEGTLHADDQQLEPLLLSSTIPLILPSYLMTGTDDQISERLVIVPVFNGPQSYSLVARKSAATPIESGVDKKVPQFVATIIEGSPQTHGIIYRHPHTLYELHELLKSADVDLIDILRNRIRALREDKQLLKASMIVIVVLPKTRGTNSKIEATDVHAFMLTGMISEAGEQAKKGGKGFWSITELGQHLGIWEITNGVIGMLLSVDEEKQGEEVGVIILNPCFSFAREDAARYNGLSARYDKRIAAIGMGALGSQVFPILVREGFGEWTLIDRDVLMPHNLARHSLYGSAVGFAKVHPLADLANDIIDGPPIAKYIIADVLDPQDNMEDVKRSFEEADAVFDFSASIAVARHLSNDIDSQARRISAFLSPSGTDLILLAEDGERRIHLTHLEMQYYRFLTLEPDLRHHLRHSDGRIRYGQSCRDLSSTIPQEDVALHAANASRALRRALDQQDAIVTIWQTDEEGNTRVFKMHPSIVSEEKLGDWILCTDSYLTEKVQKARQKKLPKETGGVLIGSFDMQRKRVYVVDVLPSPPDSQEERTLYIRGSQGLRDQVEEVEEITGRQVHYVGEWHSHPAGYSSIPSDDDFVLFGWLTEQMALDGKPSLMLIAGDNNDYSWHLGTMRMDA